MKGKEVPLVTVHYRRNGGFIRGFLEASDDKVRCRATEALERLFVSALKRHLSMAHYPLVIFSHIPCESKGRKMMPRITAAIRRAGLEVKTRAIL